MAVTIYPDADVSVTGWTDEGGASTDLYQSVNAESDATYIRSRNPPNIDEVEFTTQDPATYGSGFGNLIVRWRVNSYTNDSLTLTTKIIDDSDETELHVFNINRNSGNPPPSSFTNSTDSFSTSIFDGRSANDIKIKITATLAGDDSLTLDVAWVRIELPDAGGASPLTGAFSGALGYF